MAEIEQNALREEFRANQLTESLKSATQRITALMEEQKSLITSWELERSEILADMTQKRQDREEEFRIVNGERDRAREAQKKWKRG